MARNNLIGGGGGIGGITRAIDRNIRRDNAAISNAFSDLESLKEKSKQMVKVATQIKMKMTAKELTDKEMTEIQEVMFNMGMDDGFTSHVSKAMSGKKFYKDLAVEVERFLDKAINSDRFSGVMGLVDLFCLYNRARGTDLVSPEDMNIAC